MLRFNSALVISLLTLTLLAACTTGERLQTPELPAGAQQGLPAPSEIAADAQRQTSDSSSMLLRHGAQYLPSGNANVSKVGALAHFTPSYTGGANILDLATAIYQFDATGFSGTAQVAANWNAAPGAGNALVGLSDWANDHWDWYPLASLTEPPPLEEMADYVHPVDGRLLALVVLAGTAAADLADLHITLGTEEPYWRLSQLATGGEKVDLVKLFALQGKPAMVYWHYIGDIGSYTLSEIVLQRALDDLGESWGPPQVCWDVPVDSGYTGQVWELFPFVIDGRVTILLHAQGDDSEWFARVHYLRAADDAATAFNPPTTALERWDAYTLVDAFVADGYAAYLDHDWFQMEYGFRRATGIEGNTWSFTNVDAGAEYAGTHPRDLLLADGKPAVLYPAKDGFQTELRFRRANTASGTGSWATPKVVAPAPAELAYVHGVTLADGRPAFTFGSAPTIVFKAALDVAGDDWPIFGTFIPNMDGVSALAVEQIGGVPALSYRRSDPEALYFRPAEDALGISWTDPQLVYGGISSEASMAEFAGHPALAVRIPGDADSSYPAFFIHR